MFLQDTWCDTLSHAVHVNKDEMCANVRENTRCEGVLFTVLLYAVFGCVGMLIRIFTRTLGLYTSHKQNIRASARQELS